LYGTSQTLRLDYGTLKRRMAAARPAMEDGAAGSAMTFVELLSPVSCNIAECTLRVDSPQGGRLTVEMRNVAPQGLAFILRGFQG
jgi:hypothetical protein